MQYSIIQKSQLEGAFRLDAEYYQPEYLELEKKLNSVKTKTINELSESVVSFGAYSLTNYIKWQELGVPYLNVENIKEGFIDFDNIKFISEKVDEILKKSKVKEGQVLLTMAGTIGNAAVVHKIPKKINSNQAIAKITLKQNFSPYYLAAFLNSRYGFKQTEREIVSSVQPNIFLGQIKEFKIPIFDEKSIKDIEISYKNFLDKLENSKYFYSQAEDLLLKELGLKNFEAEDDLFSIINLSNVKKARRMDAEYFQSEWEIIKKKIGKNVIKLDDLVNLQKGLEPGSEAYQEDGKLFIRVSSISKNGIIDKDQKYLNKKLYQKLKKDFEPKVGEILLTKDATPGIAYALKEKIEGIIAGGILRLKIKKNIDAEYISLCINSVIGQSQVKRDSGGSVIAHWKPEQIKNVLIPILPKSTRQKIADLVRKSHEARKKAKELLEQAKRKVEELIEK